MSARAAWWALAFGAVLFASLLALAGFADVVRALSAAGVGLLAVAGVHLVVIVLDAASWRALLPAVARPNFARLVCLWWVGESVNSLLPVAQIGGELVRARLMTRSGAAGAVAGASVVAGLTIAVLTLIVFAATGVVLLGRTAPTGAAGAIAVGLATLGVLLGGFFWAQHNGLFLRLARLFERAAAGRAWLSLSGGAAALDDAVRSIYARRGAVARSSAWCLTGWVAGVGEVWLGLALLGHPVSLTEAFVLESLAQAIRGAGFAIPGALGVQEGSFMALGVLLGLPPEAGIAMSLIKRGRDLFFGLPGLVSWQLLEGRSLWRRRSRADTAGEAG